jgi:methionyl-tRNA formyltransferase
MNKAELRIIFMGTPAFAVASLHALVTNNYKVVAVVTAPDKPAGRGLKLMESAVKEYAVEKNIPVLQPEKLKAPQFIDALKSYNADVQVVVAFRMLPEIVWSMPRLGTINVHGSLLPNYRGAAPINWAIINGEIETGVTTFKLQHAIDTGDVLMQESIAIPEQMNAGELHDVMKEVGANTLINTLDALLKNALIPKPQHQLSTPTHAPKIFTETCLINWQRTVKEVYDFIRGLAPVPTAYTYLDGKKCKIFSAEKEYITHNNKVGSYETDNKTYLKFAAKDGFIHALDIQMEGKKRMLVAEFLRGNKLTVLG